MMRRERENRIKKGIWREIINSDGPLKNHLETYILFLFFWRPPPGTNPLLGIKPLWLFIFWSSY